MSSIKSLAERWVYAKREERNAVEFRRDIEDEMITYLNINRSSEGSKTSEIDGYKIKITTRLMRKVDSDLLQEIAAEHDLSDKLPILMRWTPEVNLRHWDAASDEIKSKLSHAITTMPGRPSFDITATTKE